ncbi:hypothetical protein DBV05_g3353 [Lasiodiplodia theobromae]|uniref:Uncharacterized protein n=2 Tax=Lasiodiplodia theobromae TaxID=45133 RepID=A0A5N5DK88_9PEZI|nr:hypothetical protein DBV05_g3353 [Lasiodiplodia theobromae]
MAYKTLIPVSGFKGSGPPTEFREVTVWENNESSDDSTGKRARRKKKEKPYRPLIGRINKFSSYDILRFRDEGTAHAHAMKISVLKEGQWAGTVYYMADLDQLASLAGLKIPFTSRVIHNGSPDAQPSVLGDWLKEYTAGDVMTPLVKLLQYVRKNWIGPDKEYAGYELRVFTDPFRADGYPPEWHVEDTSVPDTTAGVLDPSPLVVVTALKGPGTLFLRNRALGWKNYDEEGWEEYQAAAEKDQLRTGELGIFIPSPSNSLTRAGRMIGALHARPDEQDSDRVVAQLILSTKRQMKGYVDDHKETLERNRLLGLLDDDDDNKDDEDDEDGDGDDEEDEGEDGDDEEDDDE